jgi:WD40 repeat protein
MESGEIRFAHKHASDRALAVFSPDGRSLASSGADQIVRIFDTATGASRELMKAETYVTALAFSPDGKVLAVGGDHFINFWDMERGAGTSVVTTSGAYQLVFGDSATVFANLGGMLSLQRWDIEAGRVRSLLRGHTDVVLETAFSSATGVLATASRDNTARLWDPVSGESRALQGHTDDVLGVAFSPDGKLVATAGKDGAVRLWSDDLPFDPEALRARIAGAVPEPIDAAPAR